MKNIFQFVRNDTDSSFSIWSAYNCHFFMVFAATCISHYLHSGHIPFRTLIVCLRAWNFTSDFYIIVHCMFIFLGLEPPTSIPLNWQSWKREGVCVRVTLSPMCSSSEQLLSLSFSFCFIVDFSLSVGRMIASDGCIQLKTHNSSSALHFWQIVNVGCSTWSAYLFLQPVMVILTSPD